uniref:Uncharacterized protein n=1 Tax=Callorhinchus milii TaxID=7868 RepID=A0A4W3IK47_CALMI
MSSQLAQRVRQSGSPTSNRLQPLRATVPFQLRPGAAGGGGNSGCRAHTGPGEQQPEAGSRAAAPGESNVRHSISCCTSPVSKAAEKSRSHHQARSSMRRTSSLDTIIGPYLIGQWPREADGHDTTWFNEKATQTPSIWHEVRTERKNSHKRSASWGSADQLKEIAKLRHQLQRTKLSKRYGKDKGRQSPLHGDYTAMGTIQQGHPSKFIPILSANLGITKLIPRLRNSLEAINQEIEGMFIKEHGDKEVLRVGNPAEFTSLLLLRSYCMAAECVGFSRNVELKLVQCIVLGYCTLPQSLHLAPFSPFSSPVCKPSSSTPYLPPPLPWARAGSASVERSETLCEGSYISASCCCYCG